MKEAELYKQQGGFVAIFSVLIIMGILTLLTIGFTSVTRQAQLRTLNDHLNSQAFYAAESGVNMAVAALPSGLGDKEVCRGAPFADDEYNVDGENNIAVSCLLVNTTPTSLEFTNIPIVGTGDPVISYLSTDGTPIEDLRFEWDSENPADGLVNRPSADFLPDSEWGNNVGVMRVDLIPDGPTQREALVNGSYTFYLYPSQQGDTSEAVSAGLAGQGAVQVTDCDDTPSGDYRCITSIDLAGSIAESYYVRLQAYYEPVRASIAVVNSSGTEVELHNGQAVVDATGQANDVYRRIQVTVPIMPDGGFDEGAHTPFSIFNGASICKRYLGIPGGSIASDPCQF